MATNRRSLSNQSDVKVSFAQFVSDSKMSVSAGRKVLSMHWVRGAAQCNVVYCRNLGGKVGWKAM